jgi:hypothetical protein
MGSLERAINQALLKEFDGSKYEYLLLLSSPNMVIRNSGELLFTSCSTTLAPGKHFKGIHRRHRPGVTTLALESGNTQQSHCCSMKGPDGRFSQILGMEGQKRK